MGHDTDETSATPGNKLTQSQRQHAIPVSYVQSSFSNLVPNSEKQEIPSSPRRLVEGYKRYSRVANNDDELPTTAPAPKRARLAEAAEWSPKKQHTASYHQQSVPQHPATQHSAPQHSAPQLPEIQHPALSTQQTRAIPYQDASGTGQETSFVPVPEAQEQSRQLHRILLCPADAYFDILSLANGTDMFALVEASWLNLSFMLHPRVCPLPDSVKALSRVNDAYAWIQKHPGLAQPYVPPPPMPHLAQATLSTRRSSVAASVPKVDTVREPQKLWASTGTQPNLSPQQFRSGPARVLGSPPPRTFAPRPSSHVYVNDGKPTIRPTVGWQFRELGGETWVWHKGRWRPLLQSSSTFQGLRVDEDGWIMPIMNRDFNENQWRKVQSQAKFEFNSHP